MAFSSIERVVSLFATLRRGEGRGVLLLCLQAFSILFAYYMLKVLRDTLILSEGSPELKSYTNAMQAAILMVVVPIFARVYHRLGHTGAKHTLISRLILFFISNLLLFALAKSLGWSIAISFYVWLGIFSVMALALFWGFSADLYNIRTGQRVFPLIAAAATGGAFMGSKFAGWMNPVIGDDGIILFAAVMLLLPWFFCSRVEATIPPGSASHIADEFHQQPPPVSEGFMVVFRSYYLTIIAIFTIALNLINTTGEYILADFINSEANRLLAQGLMEGTRSEYMARFYGNYQAMFTLIGFLMQLFVVSRVLDRFGVRGAMLVLPILMVGTYSLMLVLPVLAIVRAALIAENSVSYSLMNTTRHALFLPVKRDEKYVGKNCIDTFFHRCGDLLSAGVVFLGSAVLDVGAMGFIALNGILALLLLWLARIIGRRNQAVIEKNLGNLPPRLGIPLPDMDIPAGEISQLKLHEDTFLDPDEGDALKYHAFQEGAGNLPPWIRFDPLHRSFEFRPPEGSEGSAEIRVVARDFEGAEAETSFTVKYKAD